MLRFCFKKSHFSLLLNSRLLNIRTVSCKVLSASKNSVLQFSLMKVFFFFGISIEKIYERKTTKDYKIGLLCKCRKCRESKNIFLNF